MTSDAVLQSLRVLAEAVNEHRITLNPHGVIHIDNTPAIPFQQLAVSVLHEWGWITWTPSAARAYATLTQRGRAELAKHCGPDFTDNTQWRAFEHWMFTVTPDEIDDAK